MERFVIENNIRHFRDRLRSELDSAQRARLRKLLVEEEDKLAANVALLADVEREMKRGHVLIARQTALIASMERDGRSGAERARKLLHCLIESQNLHEWYLEKVLTAIEANRVADFAEHLQ